MLVIMLISYTASCTGEQDIYFVVDATSSNDVNPFCQEMYALELISEAINPGSALTGPRIGSYLYPRNELTSDNNMQYFKIGTKDCSVTVKAWHRLMTAFGLGYPKGLSNKINGLLTLPAPVLNLVAEDIESEITDKTELKDRRRVVVTITDGSNDQMNQNILKNATIRLQNAGSRTTLIAAGIATKINTDDLPAFKAELMLIAGGKEENTIVTDNGQTLGLELIDVMEANGVICTEQGIIHYFYTNFHIMIFVHIICLNGYSIAR